MRKRRKEVIKFRRNVRVKKERKKERKKNEKKKEGSN